MDAAEVVVQIADLEGIGLSVAMRVRALRVWRMRHDHRALAGLSVVTQALVITSGIVWAAYAAVTSSSGLALLASLTPHMQSSLFAWRVPSAHRAMRPADPLPTPHRSVRTFDAERSPQRAAVRSGR